MCALMRSILKPVGPTFPNAVGEFRKLFSSVSIAFIFRTLAFEYRSFESFSYSSTSQSVTSRPSNCTGYNESRENTNHLSPKPLAAYLIVQLLPSPSISPVTRQAINSSYSVLLINHDEQNSSYIP